MVVKFANGTKKRDGVVSPAGVWTSANKTDAARAALCGLITRPETRRLFWTSTGQEYGDPPPSCDLASMVFAAAKSRDPVAQQVVLTEAVRRFGRRDVLKMAILLMPAVPLDRYVALGKALDVDTSNAPGSTAVVAGRLGRLL